jgi:hypothetical protein
LGCGGAKKIDRRFFYGSSAFRFWYRKSLEDTDAAKVAAIRAMRHEGTRIRRIARELGVGVGAADHSVRVRRCAPTAF